MNTVTAVNSSDNAALKNPSGAKTLYGMVNKQSKVTPNLLMTGHSTASATGDNSPGGDYNPEANHKRQVRSGLGHAKHPGDLSYGESSFDNSGSQSKAA